MNIPQLTPEEAIKIFNEKCAVFVDIRDPQSFQGGHIPGALHVNDDNVYDFIESADKTKHHIIYCYHGNSSLGGAEYFLENGFKKVHSLSGGFTKWCELFPNEVDTVD
ncbi:MAG TPA: thiosulfate sulfurtransferase GlpE [Bdellovibrionota bacterium]|nr:thiosulfate sulfurtransferase GlpE [Bdellovibrionota bacterium]